MAIECEWRSFTLCKIINKNNHTKQIYRQQLNNIEQRKRRQKKNNNKKAKEQAKKKETKKDRQKVTVLGPAGGGWQSDVASNLKSSGELKSPTTPMYDTSQGEGCCLHGSVTEGCTLFPLRHPRDAHLDP